MRRHPHPAADMLSAIGGALLAAALLGAAGAALSAEAGPRQPRRVYAAADAYEARVIVKYRESSTLVQAQKAALAAGRSGAPRHAATWAQRLGLPVQDARVLGTRTQSVYARGVTSAELARRLAQQAEVEWAVPVGRKSFAAAPNDPYFGPDQTSITPTVGQWYLRAPDSTIVSAINAAGAWDVSTGSPAMTVAVLDTGVRFEHPDLAGKLHPGYDFVHDTKSGGDGDGRDADATDPGDWTSLAYCDASDPGTDSSWHGTQVSGLIGAATNNAIGMAGAGRDVRVLPVRVLGKCGGFDDDIIAGMRWAGGLSSDVGWGTPQTVVNAHPARVLNLSLGGPTPCTAPYRDVVAELVAAGVVVVAAAGNDIGLAVSEPANCPGAVAVAGLRHIGTKVGYSNLGPEVALAAPAGNCVNLSGPCLYPLLTTINLGATTPTSSGYSNSFNYSVGTSFSAPLVAGTVGLMLSANPALSAAQVRTMLRSTARPFPTVAGVPTCRAPNSVEQDECNCTTTTCGAGMLNAAAAVSAAQAAIGGAVLPPTAVITVSTSQPVAGTTVTLSAANSIANGGRTITGWNWLIVSGATLASFSGSTSGSTATLATSAAGSVVVSLVVTDSAGATSTAATTTIQVQAPPPPPSSGGGAASLGWTLALLAAVAALRRPRKLRAAAPSPGAD